MAVRANEMVRYRHMVIIYINMKPHMESPMTPSHLTLIEFKSQTQGHPDFEALHILKEQS